MVHNKKALAATLVAAFAISGCETVTRADRINGNQFIVCDVAGSAGNCNGANPEKGLPKTCSSIGRVIDNYKKFGNKLLVSCGPLQQSVITDRINTRWQH